MKSLIHAAPCSRTTLPASTRPVTALARETLSLSPGTGPMGSLVPAFMTVFFAGQPGFRTVTTQNISQGIRRLTIWHDGKMAADPISFIKC